MSMKNGSIFHLFEVTNIFYEFDLFFLESLQGTSGLLYYALHCHSLHIILFAFGYYLKMIFIITGLESGFKSGNICVILLAGIETYAVLCIHDVKE